MFFTFLARQMARQNSGVSVDSRLFERVLESLCNAPTASAGDGAEELSHHEERQQALLELLNTRALDRFDEERLLSLSKAAKFFRVSEMIYQRRREFGRILECYCSDKARQNLVFAYVKQTIASPDITVEEKTRVREAVLEHLEDLICIDAKKTTKLVSTSVGIRLTDAVNQVMRYDNENATFDFLCCLFETTDRCDGNGESGDEDWQFDPSVYERYTELLCRRSMVEYVIAFLQFHSGYRLAKMLEICQRFRISEAVIILLEKSGDVSGAFEVSLQTLRNKLSVIVRFDDLHQKQADQLHVAVEGIISLLNRNSLRLEQLQLRQLWFTLFDLLIDNYNRLFGCKFDSSEVNKSEENCRRGTDLSPLSVFGLTSAKNKYQSVLQHTVSCMVSHVPFTAVLEHIVALGDEDGIANCFGSVKDLLSSVMDACHYQQTLYTTCARIVHKDVNGALGGLTVAARSPISLRFNACSVCEQSLNDAMKCAEVQVVCFQCGHAFHLLCLKDSLSVGKDVEESGRTVDKRWYCVICCRSPQTRFAVPFARSRVASVSKQSLCGVDSASSQSPMYSETVESVNQLRRNQQTASRLEVLSELRRLEEVKTVRSSSVQNGVGMVLGNGSAFHDEKFSLNLAPPPAR